MFKPLGVTLLEMLIAIGISAGLSLLIVEEQVILRQRVTLLQQKLRLQQALWQVISILHKELRRSGFCQTQCQHDIDQIVHISAYPGESAHSCVVFSYDLQGNRKMEVTSEPQVEWFGYRLRQRSIEIQRGKTDCIGGGWERVLDPNEITVSTFQILWERRGGIYLSLIGQLTHYPLIRVRIQHYVELVNG